MCVVSLPKLRLGVCVCCYDRAKFIVYNVVLTADFQISKCRSSYGRCPLLSSRRMKRKIPFISTKRIGYRYKWEAREQRFLTTTKPKTLKTTKLTSMVNNQSEHLRLTQTGIRFRWECKHKTMINWTRKFCRHLPGKKDGSCVLDKLGLFVFWFYFR